MILFIEGNFVNPQIKFLDSLDLFFNLNNFADSIFSRHQFDISVWRFFKVDVKNKLAIWWVFDIWTHDISLDKIAWLTDNVYILSRYFQPDRKNCFWPWVVQTDQYDLIIV